MKGLNEALEIVEAKAEGRSHKIKIEPAGTMCPEEIKAVRDGFKYVTRVVCRTNGRN